MAQSMSKRFNNNKNEVVDEFVEAIQEDVIAETMTETAKAPKKFEPMDGILCRSIVEGVLVMTGIKSKNFYKWANAGDVTEVEFQDLVSAVRSSNNTYINAPHFIIEDEDFLAQFPQVQKIYDSMYTTSDLREILNLPVGDMIATIKTLPRGSQENIKDIAGKMILNGQLDSVKKIKALDELYNTNYLITTNLYA